MVTTDRGDLWRSVMHRLQQKRFSVKMTGWTRRLFFLVTTRCDSAMPQGPQQRTGNLINLSLPRNSPSITVRPLASQVAIRCSNARATIVRAEGAAIGRRDLKMWRRQKLGVEGANSSFEYAFPKKPSLQTYTCSKRWCPRACDSCHEGAWGSGNV
jgi:hypothetical protein